MTDAVKLKGVGRRPNAATLERIVAEGGFPPERWWPLLGGEQWDAIYRARDVRRKALMDSIRRLAARKEQ